MADVEKFYDLRTQQWVPGKPAEGRVFGEARWHTHPIRKQEDPTRGQRPTLTVDALLNK